MRKRIAAAAAITAVAALPAGVAVAENGGGHGDGTPGRSADAPGQLQKQEATQAHARGQSGDDAKSESKRSEQAKPDGKAHGNKHRQSGARPTQSETTAKASGGSSTHAKAGKTTICHATGSATNPYVAITISDNALPAHSRHQDGRDIVPAPAAGCPKGDVSGQSDDKDEHGDTGDHEHGKVTICHATGSATNPYVEITIARPAVAAHGRHQDGRDIIPAPATGCPRGGGGMVQPGSDPTGSTPGGSTPAGTTPTGTAPSGESAPVSGYASEGARTPSAVTVLGATERSGTSPDAAGGSGPQVLGETASSGTAPGAEATRQLARGSLPFTGMDLVLAALVAAGLLLAGFALRRAATQHR